MSQFFTLAILVAVLASGIRLATPYLLADLGETVGQRSGVLNLGVDGVMQPGAFGAYYTVIRTGDLWLGTLVAIGIFIFGFGVSDLLFRELVGTPKPIGQLPQIKIPLLGEIPKVGEALFQQTLLTYAAFGLNVRSVGENPQAADSLGISVERTRFAAILIGNVMAGLAGAALVLELGIFQPNLTQGLGFIAIALVYFGSWRPVGVMWGALLYGLVNSTVLQLKAQGTIPVSGSDLANMVPAVLTILAGFLALSLLAAVCGRAVEEPAGAPAETDAPTVEETLLVAIVAPSARNPRLRPGR